MADSTYCLLLTHNTMPLILDCVKAYCTVGEISDALREVYRTYEEPAVF